MIYLEHWQDKIHNEDIVESLEQEETIEEYEVDEFEQEYQALLADIRSEADSLECTLEDYVTKMRKVALEDA